YRVSAQTVRSRFFSQRTRTVAGEFSRQLHSLRLAPQTLEVVKLSRLLLEDMDHEIAVVQQNPLRGFVALNARGGFAGFLELVVNSVGDRLHLSLVRAAEDHKVVGETRDLAQVQHDRIDGFLLAASLKGCTYPLVELVVAAGGIRRSLRLRLRTRSRLRT